MDGRLIGERGGTLLEAVVALAVGLVLAGVLTTLLRIHSEVARRQAVVSNLQQSLRIARRELERFCRPAGRGGLPAEVAIAVRSGAASRERIGGPGTPVVAAGTDVLIVRGVLRGALWQVAAADGDPESLRLTLQRNSAAAPALEPLLHAARLPESEALLLSAGPASSRCRITGVVGATAIAFGHDGELTELSLETRSSVPAVGEGYRELAESCEALEVDEIRRIGVLEEVRFYIREAASSTSRRRLSRVSFYPGTERSHPRSPRGGVALVDGAFDLQVALGFDLDRDGSIDEWRHDDPGDSGSAPWLGGALELVRLTLVMRARRPGRGHLAPALGRIEDRVHAETDSERLRPRARVTTTLSLRGR